MKKLLLLTFLTTFICIGVSAQSTVTTYPTLTQNNGTSGVTFEAVTTSNINVLSFATTISTGTSTINVWYRPGGVLHPSASTPGVTTANGWVFHEAVSVTSTNLSVPTSFTLTTPLSLPPGTYGFYVGGTSVRYMTYNSSLASTFTDGTLTLNTGPGNGFGGTLPSPTFTTRCYVGSVTYELGIKAPNDAGISDIITPGDTCEGNYNVDVEVTNFGTNSINPVQINWSFNGVPQTPVTYNSTLDTINGTGPSSAIVTLGSVTLTANNSHDIAAWTSMPNNVVDTSRRNDSTIIAVIGYPYPTIDLGVDTTICPGEPLSLDAGIRDSVRWQNNTNNQFLNVANAGQYSVTVYENACASRDTINISLHPAPPTVDFGPDTTLCFGETLLLDATTPGVTYLWQDNSTNPTFTVDTIGRYTVILEDVNTCNSEEEIRVDYFTVPSVLLIVSPRNEICNQTPYVFRAFPTTQGSIDFQWRVNGNAVGPVTTDATFTGPLNYGDSVSVDLITDICSTAAYPVPSEKIEMILNPAPKAINGKTKVIENTSSIYLVPLTPTSSYVWRVSGGTINGDSTNNNVSIDWGSANPNATLILEETDGANCVRENEIAVDVVSIVGVGDLKDLLQLGDAYPNPSNNMVTIPVFANGNSLVEISLVDISGKLVRSIYNGVISGDQQIQFDVTDLRSGMYFYKLSTSEGYQTVRKLTVQH